MKQKLINLLQPLSGICIVAGVTLTIFTRDNTAPLIFLITGLLMLLANIYFENMIYFSKVKPDAKIPTKRKEDAAYDLYANFMEDYIIIYPNEVKMIPTGIASSFSDQYAFILYERGSTGSKNMGLRAGVIDSGFRNEWMVLITNHNNEPLIIAKKEFNESVGEDYWKRKFGNFYTLYPYEKAIAQALLIPVPNIKIKETTYEKILKIKSERGLGMLGSSNK